VASDPQQRLDLLGPSAEPAQLIGRGHLPAAAHASEESSIVGRSIAGPMWSRLSSLRRADIDYGPGDAGDR